MKIKEFSNKFNLSYDTIRYYMKLNLINPQKVGGHYEFDSEDQNDIKEILSLKKMEFSLDEIKEILSFKRIGRLSNYQKNSYYQNIYQEKLKNIENRIIELKEAKNALNSHLTKLKAENKNKQNDLSLNLNHLNLFACPSCGSDLTLSAQKIETNRIHQGSLNCNCGEKILIKEGILYTKEIYEQQNQEKIFKTDPFFHVTEYINETNAEFMDQSYQSLDWLKNRINYAGLKNKVILEPGSGYGFLLRNIYDQLPSDTTYICIEHSSELNRYLKSLLELSPAGPEVIFLTAELPNLPLKKKSLDYLIDFSGISNFSFHNQEFLPELLLKYFKENFMMTAVFIIYHKFGENNIVKRKYRDYFMYSNIRLKLKEMGLEFLNEYKSEIKKIERSMGKYEEFAQIGDQIFSYQVNAKKRKQK
ncbi:DNA-binding transcriptional MerR regulator [Halanaerobium saccharolyticum]|uniref:DNA-binding transcriptional MerR regulator n=1 Tax=Halanaerobium saccharolyticum TaxID=43595 RepID=A0A4V3G4B1_9FIRM|nr:MerR family transcriptional regulator [Halanaerobium saccharolyticum]RAK05359.1 DNA-binding transcriptional MerR regulator [Halanaerobium saccharolyticum]TDV99717.1 DNA-binding transcriptional MerR regulator [Halanaerobium saccharolyticum]TDX51874.1 DNA-binding transcriptional MerR regulator [Halanaerobium saccharolyticum]